MSTIYRGLFEAVKTTGLLAVAKPNLETPIGFCNSRMTFQSVFTHLVSLQKYLFLKMQNYFWRNVLNQAQKLN